MARNQQNTMSKKQNDKEEQLPLSGGGQTGQDPKAEGATAERAKGDRRVVHRFLEDHKVNGLNERLLIQVMDEPGAGGANHEYRITLHPGKAGELGEGVTLKFQNGGIAEAGYNGLSNEALLAVLIDRMRGFQSGPFKCDKNQHALQCLEAAMHWLKERTAERLERGVEGRQVR